MEYDVFKAELKRAKLSVKAFAEILNMNPTSITNYRRIGSVPKHLATIAVLIAALTERGISYEEIIEKAK